MKIKLSKKDIIWSYIGIILSMGSNLLMLPFIIYFLDDDMYGLWGVFSSIGAVATLFDCGFSVTFARNITYCWSGATNFKKEGVVSLKTHETDFKLLKKILITCKNVYLVVSSLAYLFLLLCGTWYVVYVSRNISGHLHLVAWLIYSTAIFMNLYYGYYASFLRGVGAVDQANVNTVVARIVQIVMTIVLLVCRTGLIGVCIAYLSYGFVFRTLGKYKFYHYKNIGDKVNAINYQPGKSEMKELFIVVWYNAWKDGLISVCNYLCNQASTIICSFYLSLAETGIYALGVQIATAIAQIAGALYTAYQPMLQEAYISNDIDKQRQSMSIIVTSYIYLFILGTLATVVVGIPFIRLIKPGIKMDVLIILGLCLFQFIMKFRNCYTSYFSCTNRINYLCGFITSSVATIVLSLIFIDNFGWGVWGLIIAQIISQVMYNFWYWPFLAHKELGYSFFDMINMGNKNIYNIIRKNIKRKV